MRPAPTQGAAGEPQASFGASRVLREQDVLVYLALNVGVSDQVCSALLTTEK